MFEPCTLVWLKVEQGLHKALNDLLLYLDITELWPCEARDGGLMGAMTAKAIPSAVVVCRKGQPPVHSANQTEMSELARGKVRKGLFVGSEMDVYFISVLSLSQSIVDNSDNLHTIIQMDTSGNVEAPWWSHGRKPFLFKEGNWKEMPLNWMCIHAGGNTINSQRTTIHFLCCLERPVWEV